MKQILMIAGFVFTKMDIPNILNNQIVSRNQTREKP